MKRKSFFKGSILLGILPLFLFGWAVYHFTLNTCCVTWSQNDHCISDMITPDMIF